MKRLLLCITMLCAATSARGGSSLTLADAIATARANHPEGREVRADLAAAAARSRQARAGYLPRVDLSADWSRGDIFLTALERSKTVETASAIVSATQILYDFGRTGGSAAAADGAEAAAGAAAGTTLADLSLRVKEAYYGSLAAERQVEAVRAEVAVRDELARQARAFFTEGVRSRVDVARAEAAFYAARSLLIRAENELGLARLALANAMGEGSLGDRTLAEPPASAAEPGDLSGLREKALAGRSELKRLASLRDAAGGSLRAARGEHLPVLAATAGYGFADRELPPDGRVWNMGISLTVPLFTGFAATGRVREAEAALEGLAARRASLELAVARDVETAWLAVREATARTEATAREREAAGESRELATARYREGVGSMVEASDAAAVALAAETAHIRAGYDRAVALARLERAIGRNEE